MKLTDQTEITQDVIDYINSLTKSGKSLAKIIAFEKGDIDKNSLEKLRKAYSRRISKSGYKFNSELSIYQSKDSLANTNDPIKIGSSKEKKDTPRKRVTKKEKELENKLKENPLYFETRTYRILENIDQIYNQLENGSVQLSILIYPSLLKEFKKLEKRFGYVGSHYVQSCAILSCYQRIDHLKESTLLHEYLNFISTNLKHEKKKQLIIKSPRSIAAIKKLLEYEFPFLNKGDVIGLCFFSFLRCYEKSLE